jgi:hypothetical protein
MPTNYVFIDFENVQPSDLRAFNQEYVRVIVFVGANQSKIPTDFAVALQKFKDRGEYVIISGNGPNALDFHIAFYLGQRASEDPKAFFHIVSKDSGFDPLIEHLKANKVRASRVPDIGSLAFVKAATEAANDPVSTVVAILRKSGAAKPRSVKTLTSSIKTSLHSFHSPVDPDLVVQELAKRKLIKIDGLKVAYLLPDEKPVSGE